jgi:bifunctional non-homologous end joining protein LigD
MASSAGPAQLQRYRAKRDFARTPEPSGAARHSGNKLEFVIQRHHARRLHYDFRLEWNGVLKSWAVPKGPSLDPAEKRLAVEVEDHPFEYRTFSGEIPAGAYGAGQVLLWDRGSWEPDGDVDQGLAKGKLDFTLEGERLHGRWTLVRLAKAEGGKQNWLLIKGRDEHAARAANGLDVTELYATGLGKERKTARPAAPAFIAPQLATAVDSVPATGEWLTELKFDGYRIVAHVDRKRARCFTRSGHDWSHRMPAVVEALAGLALQDSWLDGELVAVDERGMPQFQRLQQALDPGTGEAPVLLVFDAMRLLGADLRDKPQRERKRLLQQALASLPREGSVRLVDFVDDESEALRAQACEQGFEGVILKDAGAPYESGRNRAWLKLKCRREQEFVIGGYTRTVAGRKTLTALLLGYYDQGGALQFAGRAGTGFSDAQLTSLRRRLDGLGVAQCPFAQMPGLRRTERPQWVEPELVAQVRFAEWTESGILRQPLFLGIREDIAAASVRREPDRIVPPPQPQVKAESMAKAKAEAKAKARAKGKAKLTTAGRAKKIAAASPATRPSRRKPDAHATSTLSWLTHPQRVLYPTDGVTKRQLADYYESIAPVLWPHLQRRPLSVIRATSAPGRVFFQRHLDADIPGLTPVAIPGSDDEPYFACSSLESIPRLAQIGAVELHTWGSRAPRAERADRITFDLDPDPTLPWKPVREAATLVRGLLQELGLQCLLKTTGGQGLHLVVPLVRGPAFEVAAAFSRRVAEHLAYLIPERFTAKRGAPNRKGRIYLDWQRNQLAATTVAAYSPRHRPGVPVSLPIDWDELGRDDIRAAHFNLRNVAARVVAQGDAWQKLDLAPQALTQRVIARLERAGQ